MILGDARLRLREAPGASYGLIILDAFSSDAIPMHLLTRKALRVYRGTLADGGLIAFHISNRYIDLAPVLGLLARDAGLVARVRDDLGFSPKQFEAGLMPSIWVVMAARGSGLGPLAQDPRWREPASRPDDTVWTDDFSNIITHLYLNAK